MKLNPDVKAKWLAALRSGKYTQGRLQLRNPADKYCCIGVLCDISGMGEWRNAYNDAGYDYAVASAAFGTLREWATAPGAVRDWAVSDLLDGDDWETLVMLNDHDKLSFHEIADWIENNL